jgi:hypothetical protein
MLLPFYLRVEFKYNLYYITYLLEVMYTSKTSKILLLFCVSEAEFRENYGVCDPMRG